MKQVICPFQGELEIVAGEQALLLDIIRTENDVGNLNINIGDNARVDYVFVADYEGAINSSGQREINVGSSSIFNSSRLYLKTGQAAWNFNHNFTKNSQIDERVLFYQNEKQSLKINDRCLLSGPGNKAKLCVDGILEDEAKSEYLSELIIAPQAQDSDTRIDMQLYIFGDQARGTMLPALKIAAHEVKAGHGAGTFKLSSEDLFYLRSRGLSEQKINHLVLEGLLNSFLKRLKSQDLKEEILKRAAKYLSLAEV